MLLKADRESSATENFSSSNSQPATSNNLEQTLKRTVASKLVELRIKTDRELLALAKSELWRAQIMASVAATKRSPLHQRADQIVRRTAKLLSTISGVDERERETLESILREVRLALDRIPAQVRYPALSTAGG